MVRGGQRRRECLLELDRSGVAAAPGTPPSPAPSSGAFPWWADSGCTCATFFYFLTCGRINIFLINVVDSGILGIFCFEVYVLLKCENLCRRIGKEH